MNLLTFESHTPISGCRLNTHMYFKPFEYWDACLAILGPGSVHTW